MTEQADLRCSSSGRAVDDLLGYPDSHTEVYADKGADASDPTSPSPVVTTVDDDAGRLVSASSLCGRAVRGFRQCPIERRSLWPASS